MLFATKLDIVFDGIFDDIQKIGQFYPLFILFANDIYVCWKENGMKKIVFCCIIGYNNIW